jgi:hypothetical protein
MKSLIEIVEEQIRIYQKEMAEIRSVTDPSKFTKLTGKIEAGQEILAIIKIVARFT